MPSFCGGCENIPGRWLTIPKVDMHPFCRKDPLIACLIDRSLLPLFLVHHLPDNLVAVVVRRPSLSDARSLFAPTIYCPFSSHSLLLSLIVLISSLGLYDASQGLSYSSIPCLLLLHGRSRNRKSTSSPSLARKQRTTRAAPRPIVHHSSTPNDGALSPSLSVGIIPIICHFGSMLFLLHVES